MDASSFDKKIEQLEEMPLDLTLNVFITETPLHSSISNDNAVQQGYVIMQNTEDTVVGHRAPFQKRDTHFYYAGRRGYGSISV